MVVHCVPGFIQKCTVLSASSLCSEKTKDNKALVLHFILSCLDKIFQRLSFYHNLEAIERLSMTPNSCKILSI